MSLRGQVLLFVSTLAGLLAGPAAAAATRVALIRPSTASAAVTEALARIQGELTADGFEVVLVDANADPSPNAAIERDRDAGAQASIGFVIDTVRRTAELRVVDRLTNKAVVRQTPIDETTTSRDAEILAVRAVELLRASLLELMIEEPPPAEASAPHREEIRQATKWAAQALPASRPSRWSVEAGAAALASFEGIGPAVLSVLRGRFAFSNPLALRVTLAGLGTQPRVDAPAGSATVTEDFGLLELVVRPWPRAPLRPVFSLGAGALYTGVDGQAAAPYSPRQTWEVSAIVDAGAGLEWALGQRFAVALEIHALLAQPYPVVRFLDDEVARAGEPSILAALTLMGSP